MQVYEHPPQVPATNAISMSWGSLSPILSFLNWLLVISLGCIPHLCWYKGQVSSTLFLSFSTLPSSFSVLYHHFLYFFTWSWLCDNWALYFHCPLSMILPLCHWELSRFLPFVWRALILSFIGSWFLTCPIPALGYCGHSSSLNLSIRVVSQGWYVNPQCYCVVQSVNSTHTARPCSTPLGRRCS